MGIHKNFMYLTSSHQKRQITLGQWLTAFGRGSNNPNQDWNFDLLFGTWISQIQDFSFWEAVWEGAIDNGSANFKSMTPVCLGNFQWLEQTSVLMSFFFFFPSLKGKSIKWRQLFFTANFYPDLMCHQYIGGYIGPIYQFFAAAGEHPSVSAVAFVTTRTSAFRKRATYWGQRHPTELLKHSVENLQITHR